MAINCMKRILIIILSVALAVTASAKLTNDRRDTGQNVADRANHGLYKDVLDRVFPRTKFDPLNEGRVLTLRILPTYHAESQLVIRERYNAPIQVIFFTLGEGESNISVYINRLRTNKADLSIENVIKGLNISTTTIDKPSFELERTIRDIPEIQLPANVGSVIFVDGVSYELWATSAAGEFHASYWDHWPSANVKLNPIPAWMIKVMELAQAASTPSPTESNK